MDPVSALGAAGSVVGIAAFGVQLSAALYRVYAQINDAKECLQAALDGIDSTAAALERIYEFLQIEERNLKKGRGLLLFSDTAILGVENTAHQCLVIFWKIEATITNKSGPKFEKELSEKLSALTRNENSTKPPVFALDRSLVETASSFRNRARWKFKGDLSKLEGYSRRLHQFQSSLTLMFSVVSFGIIQRSHQQEDWKQTAEYNYIRGIAVQGNIHSIAAQFSDKTNPGQTSLSVINFGGKDVGSRQSQSKEFSEESLPSVPKLAQQRKNPSMLPKFNSHRPDPEGHSHGRSLEQMEKDRTFSKEINPPQSHQTVSRTAMEPINTADSQSRPAGKIVPAEGNSGGRGIGRSTSRSSHKRRSTKLETGTAHQPGFLSTNFENADIRYAAGIYAGDRQERAGTGNEETNSTSGVQLGSHQGPSPPKSLSTEFASEGSSTAVPEAQTCVYIIKHGTSHAIPHRLEPGIRDIVNNALRLRPSQKSVYKKIASLSSENIAALQTVLDDGGITPQTRRLVQLNILQKSRFQIGSRKDATVLAIVEDSYPQRPWRDYGESTEENEDYLLRRQSYPGSPPQVYHSTSLDDRFGPQFNEDLESSGRARLVKRRLHRDVQDVSTDMMNREDYQAAMTTYCVWIIQQHPSLRQRELEPQNWARCTVTEDLSSQDVIAERLHALDKKGPSVNIKRLSLRPDQQTQISRLHETVLNDEPDIEYQWSLRQLDLIRSKSKPFQLVPTVTAIFVYLARTPRAHVNLRRLFEMQHTLGDNSRPIYLSSTDGAKPMSVLQPSPHLNNDNPFLGQPTYRPNIRIDSPLLPPWDRQPPPPLPPDAPYNPYGPPQGFPPPPPPPLETGTGTRYDFADRRTRIPPPSRHVFPRSSKQDDYSDDSTDSGSWSEQSMFSDETSKKHPEKQETRMKARLGHLIVVLKHLDEDQVEEVLKMSEDRELKVDPADSRRSHGHAIDDGARLSALQLKAVGRQDRSFERVRAPLDEGHYPAAAAANATDYNIHRRLPYRHRSLLHDSKLRRKPSDMHLRSSAIARLGIPQAEARVALEANRVLSDLDRSVSDLNLADRRAFYPSQFDNTPYDPQRNADDKIINQLLLDWTPQGVGVPRGNGFAYREMRRDGANAEGSVASEGQDSTAESAEVDDEYYSSSEESSVRGSISQTRQHSKIPGAELHNIVPADQDARSKPAHEEETREEADPVWENDPTTEIARLEERPATLRAMRDGKKPETGLMWSALDEKIEQGTEPRLADAVTTPPTQTQTQSQIQTQEDPSTAERDNNAWTSSPPVKPAVQRRVTMDEVPDEADTRNWRKYQPPAETRDGESVTEKPVRASTFPKDAKTSETELEWAQRALEDSTAISEPADPARAEIVFGSPSRRSVRAAQREASKRKQPDRGRLGKAVVE